MADGNVMDPATVEACAKACEDYASRWGVDTPPQWAANDCAKLIRQMADEQR